MWKERLEKAHQEQEAKTPVDPNDANYYHELDPKLVKYARQRMPDITLEKIHENALEIQFNMEQGGMLDGHPLGLVIDKFTGIIYNHIFIPK